MRDINGNIIELKCTYDNHTKNGVTPIGEKRVPGIIQWVSVSNSIQDEIRIYDRLFTKPIPCM